MLRTSFVLAIVLVLGASLLMGGCSSLERKMLFFPTHQLETNGLTPWLRGGETIGFARKVEAPKNVWLMLHGNAGQAADRAYAIPSFAADDAVFILEYPGYGLRDGAPSRRSIDQAAQEAYLLLRRDYPQTPVCVVGESIGSGPASALTALRPAPDKLVLIVPFEQLAAVAKDHFPSLLVALILPDNWDNIAVLTNYRGPIEIYGAAADTVIPVKHAKALAAALPAAKFVLIDGGHNDWSEPGRVRIRNP
jgi:uncharacterized protein